MMIIKVHREHGTQQGDGISPKLFVLYLKKATGELKREIGRNNIELSYADDQIFRSHSKKLKKR